jgi:hypothetical protein
MLEEIQQANPLESFLIYDGFDDCIIGFERKTFKIVYSESKILKKLTTELEYDPDSAVRYMEQKMMGTIVGERAPVFVDDCF